MSQLQPELAGNRGAPFVPTVSPSPPVILTGVNNQTAAVAVNRHTRTVAPQASAVALSLQDQPVPSLPPMKPPPMYVPMQQSREPETIIPPNHYPANRPSTPLNPLPHSEPPAFLPKPPAWPQADNATYSNNHANHNNYSNTSHNIYPRRNEYAPRPGMGAWSRDGSPAVGLPEFQEYPCSRVYSEPRRRDQFDHRSHHDWSRQRHYRGGGGGRGGGRRWWQEWDRGSR